MYELFTNCTNRLHSSMFYYSTFEFHPYLFRSKGALQCMNTYLQRLENVLVAANTFGTSV